MRAAKGTHKKKRRPESFESWCRRARSLLPGDPTPAVSSCIDECGLRTKAFFTAMTGPSLMPALTTTLEIFCLRTGRVFRARGSAVKLERYERPGAEINYYRLLVACKRCPDTHLLLNPYQAACFELLGDPTLTRRDRSFGRNGNRHLFERRTLPPVEPAAARRARKKAA